MRAAVIVLLVALSGCGTSGVQRAAGVCPIEGGFWPFTNCMMRNIAERPGPPVEGGAEVEYIRALASIQNAVRNGAMTEDEGLREVRVASAIAQRDIQARRIGGAQAGFAALSYSGAALSVAATPAYRPTMTNCRQMGATVQCSSF